MAALGLMGKTEIENGGAAEMPPGMSAIPEFLVLR
jgi:hypothetical protein